MPATIHRTCHGERVGFLFGDRYALTGQRGNGHAQVCISGDLHFPGLTFNVQVVGDKGAAFGALVDSNGHGGFLDQGFVLVVTPLRHGLLAAADQRSAALARQGVVNPVTPC